MPFLTLLDSNAKVKGSRDSLGVQGVWTSLGRQIVGNLTTVSTSLPDFTTLLLGYWLVEQLADKAPEVDVFLRWEQWAAYARNYPSESGGSVRGVERVNSRLSEGPRVVISAEREHQILSNQKTYGLWGLYSMPARASGLMHSEHSRLSPPAHAFVEEVLLPKLTPVAGKGARILLDRLERPRYKLQLDGDDAPLVKTVRKLLAASAANALSDRERTFYREHLLHGGPQGERMQPLAVETMPMIGDRETPLGPQRMREWVKRAQRTDADLATRLENVRVAETLLAPCAALFSFIIGQNERMVGKVAADVAETWGTGFSALEVEGLQFVEPHLPSGWIGVAEAIRAADYAEVIQRLQQINVRVMQERGSAPWFHIEDGRIRVRYFEASRPLPPRKALSTLWEHSYFLDSLASMALQISA